MCLCSPSTNVCYYRHCERHAYISKYVSHDTCIQRHSIIAEKPQPLRRQMASITVTFYDIIRPGNGAGIHIVAAARTCSVISCCRWVLSLADCSTQCQKIANFTDGWMTLLRTSDTLSEWHFFLTKLNNVLSLNKMSTVKSSPENAMCDSRPYNMTHSVAK